MRNRTSVAILGTCLLMLASSVGLAISRAEGVPEWMFSAPPSVPKLPAEVSVKAEKALTLQTKIVGISTTFSCESAVGEGTLLEAEGKGSGKLFLSKCKTLLNGATAPECTPKDSVKGTEAILTKSLKSQLALHEGATLLRVQAVEGETLAMIEMSASCPIGTKVPVIGTFYTKDSNGKFETEEVEHAFVTGPLTELWAISKTAEHKATSGGSAKASLTGEGLGASWGGLGS